METKAETQTFEIAVEKTVKFWSEKAFKTPMNWNNGDDSHNGGMAFLLANMVSKKAQEGATEEKIKLFEDTLTALLLKAKADGDNYKLTLDVDYHPCRMLSDAATAAQLDSNCFPCKTFTRIERDNSVVGRYQYGGDFFTL